VLTGQELIERLELLRHPEGGWYAEIHRSNETVLRADGARRSAGTLIYFLLEAGDCSRWHRVAATEHWTHVAGGPLALHRFGGKHSVATLGDVSAGYTPALTVAPDVWQAALPLGDWTLVTCAVSPGFDFADFELIEAGSPDRSRLAALEAPPQLLGEG